MNLINCAHKCIHQKDGYCTLERLNDSYTSPTADCVYFCGCSNEQPTQISDVTNGDKL